MNIFKKDSVTFFSPWLHAAAIGLLALIIIVFVVNNIKRDREQLTRSLFNKGQAIIRFIGAGTRSSMMMGVQDGRQLQGLIEQAAENSDIHYIILTDAAGKIIAHNDPSQISTIFEEDQKFLGDLPIFGAWHIVSPPPLDEKLFEVVAPFNPFPHGKGRRHFMRMQKQLHDQNGPASDRIETNPENWETDFCPGPPGAGGGWHKMFSNNDFKLGDFFIHVGLDMSEMDTAIKNNRFQIIIMAFVLLLIGVGGWLSLLTAQGFRVSQKTLEHMQAFTGLLISRLPVGIIATDDKGEIQTCNGVAGDMLNLEAANALHKQPHECLPSDVADLLSLPPESEILDREFSVSGQNGQVHTLHLSSVPVFDNTNIFTGRVLLLHDLTEIKHLEKEIRRQDRLAALGKMAAGVAHEVRNPLSSIKGFATLLGSKFARQSEEQQVAGMLVKEVERLNRSITELLNYTKPLPLQKTAVKLQDILADSLRLIDSDARENSVTIEQQLNKDLPPLFVDTDRIAQVFINLFLNALQAMPTGGSLAIRGSMADEPGMIEISIQDSGSGISPEHLERVTDPYFTTRKDGTGLGLAIVQKIIEEHDGALHFSSRVNEGTVVTILLPIAP